MERGKREQMNEAPISAPRCPFLKFSISSLLYQSLHYFFYKMNHSKISFSKQYNIGLSLREDHLRVSSSTEQ